MFIYSKKMFVVYIKSRSTFFSSFIQSAVWANSFLEATQCLQNKV